MNYETLGKVIANLRKEKGVTQEDLAKKVGISTQAVSKWECGGMPDAELLPQIADYFNVSIDRLFGREESNYSDLKAKIAQHISSFEQEERFNQAMEYCWEIEKALGGVKGITRPLKLELDVNQDNYTHSQMQFQSGISTFSLSKNMPYFFIMPEPVDGWEKGFLKREEYVNLFKLLGDSDVLNSLFLLYKRDNKPFTVRLLETNLKISAEKAKQLIETLKLYKLVTETEIDLDDVVQTIYNFTPNPAFIFLLAITKEIIKRPNHFINFCTSRDKNYL